MKSTIDAIDRMAETVTPINRAFMKWMLRAVRNEMQRQQRLDVDDLHLAAAGDRDHHDAHDRDRGEHRDHDAEAHGDRKAANRAGAEPEQDGGGDQRRHVAVDNRRVGAVEAGVDGGERALALARFLADALVDEDVGVDRKADAEHDAGDAGQRQRRAEQRQCREGQEAR